MRDLALFDEYLPVIRRLVVGGWNLTAISGFFRREGTNDGGPDVDEVAAIIRLHADAIKQDLYLAQVAEREAAERERERISSQLAKQKADADAAAGIERARLIAEEAERQAKRQAKLAAQRSYYAKRVALQKVEYAQMRHPVAWAMIGIWQKQRSAEFQQASLVEPTRPIDMGGLRDWQEWTPEMQAAEFSKTA